MIDSPDHPELAALVGELAALAAQLDQAEAWPASQLELCASTGVFQWFVPRRWGGQEWDAVDVLRGYRALSEACLATTFVLTQRTGACTRIATSDNAELQDLLLPGLASGELFATVGISHLTTSRRHLAQPPLRAYPCNDGFRLEGYSPWVTGAAHADFVVVGATVMDGEQATPQEILAVVPCAADGVTAPQPARLVALSASHTGPLELRDVRLGREWILAGPQERVMSHGAGGSTGGLQTSTLALGLASAALNYLASEAQRRDDLVPPEQALQAELAQLDAELLAAARGAPVCSAEQLRQRANSLALRSTQAALAGAKGAGYMAGHPAGRWCREALFFLVWSCPQPVVHAHLCELAGLA